MECNILRFTGVPEVGGLIQLYEWICFYGWECRGRFQDECFFCCSGCFFGCILDSSCAHVASQNRTGSLRILIYGGYSFGSRFGIGFGGLLELTRGQHGGHLGLMLVPGWLQVGSRSASRSSREASDVLREAFRDASGALG